MWGLQLPADFGGQTLSDLVFMRILLATVWRIDYVREEMEAGSNEEATAIVQAGNDGGGASKRLFISFCSHSRHFS